MSYNIFNMIGQRGTQGLRGMAGQNGRQGQAGTSGGGFDPTNPAWLQPGWYVAPVTGSDDNDGLTPATAVRTVMGGIVERWGTPSPIISQTVTIYLLESESFNQEAVVLSPVLVEGASLIVLGTNVVLGTTTISSIVSQLDPDNGTNLIVQLTAPIVGLVPGTLVVNVTKNSHSTIESITGNDLLLTTPLLSPGLTTPSAFPTVTADGPWTVGDTLRFEEYPLLNLHVLEPHGGDASNPYGEGPVCWLQNIFVPSEIAPGFSQFSPFPIACSLVFSDCRVDPFVTLDAQLSFFTGQLQNAFLAGGSLMGPFARFFGGSSNSSLNNYHGWFGGIADYNVILHGNGSVVPPGVTLGQVQLTEGNFSVYYGATVTIFRAVLPAIVWGDSGMFVNMSNSSVANVSFNGVVPWTQALQLTGGLFLNGSATGSAFVPGAVGNPFTPGIAITSANLDANTGLQNPFTGTRFAGPIGDLTFF